MIMKECNSAAWLKQVKKHIIRLEQFMVMGKPHLDEARELSAAANILCEELMHENAKVGK